jgi:transcriptional regulator with XRE-family HTH domain
VGLFKRHKSPAQLSARQLANTLHDAGMTDQQIADSIGASRSQITKIRNGQETGTILRPRLIALVEGRVPVVDEPQRKASARPTRPVHRRPRSAPATPAVSATRDLVPHIDTSASDAVGLEGSIDGRQFGWGGPDGRPTKQPPEHVKRDRPTRLHVSRPPTRTTIRTPPPVATHGRTDTRTLKRAYDALRQSGFSDAEAQHILAPFRELAQRQRTATEREPDFTSFLNQAEQELRTGNNTGLWTTADVIERAKMLARQDASQRQTPRLPDPEVRLLTAPAPGPEPTPMFRDTQLAWPRQPARRSLGDSLAAMHEDTARQVSDMVTAVLRQSIQQAPGPPEAPIVQAPPAWGTPATLGAPVGLRTTECGRR